VVGSLAGLLKKFFATPGLTSAAKAAGENKPITAALKRCATQNQVQRRLFPQPVRRLTPHRTSVRLLYYFW
jgi:hypothetical protein